MASMCVFFPHLHTTLTNPNKNIRKLKKTHIITRKYCPELICLWKAEAWGGAPNHLKSVIL